MKINRDLRLSLTSSVVKQKSPKFIWPFCISNKQLKIKFFDRFRKFPSRKVCGSERLGAADWRSTFRRSQAVSLSLPKSKTSGTTEEEVQNVARKELEEATPLAELKDPTNYYRYSSKRSFFRNQATGATELNKPLDTDRNLSRIQPIRSTHLRQNLVAKQRVVRMLFVLVAEFFICWTPLFLVNLFALWVPRMIYGVLGNVGISLIQLLAYASSCCNPITYCFMNATFLQSFKQAFCLGKGKRKTFQDALISRGYHSNNVQRRASLKMSQSFAQSTF